MLFDPVHRIFKDKDGKEVIWHKRDRFNVDGQHNPHPEYAREDLIEECLKNPLYVCTDKDDPSRTCFYLDVVEPGAAFALKVVVAQRRFLKPRLVTVFSVAGKNPNDTIIWQRTP